MKNNIKFILGFILGGIICTSIGISATIYYEASQINYKNTTLDHAIDDLYTTQNNTINELQTSLNNYTYFGQYLCVNGLSKTANNTYSTINYNSVKLESTSGNSNATIKIIDKSDNELYTMSVGTTYSTSNLKRIQLYMPSSGDTWGCGYIKFFNS